MEHASTRESATGTRLTPRAGLGVLVALLLATALQPLTPAAQVAGALTSPRQQFGADIGDDYFLATYAQLEEYWRVLDRQSPRMSLVDIGSTAEGRSQWMAVVTAPENHARLDRYRAISRRLATASGLTDAEARALAAEGKAVVWIDGGIHADEVVGSQQLIELVYQLVSRSDAETLRVLRDVIVLVAHANPDGHALVADWYMQEPDPRRRSLAHVPRLYHKYIGHDNNRDFFLSSQPETTNINRVLYREWFPQIVYDHHQTGPMGTVMFAPPFRDPFNYALDPLVPAMIDMVGSAMQARFVAEGKGGVTTRLGATYSTWWNGGLRTTAYFHNQIGLLTEIIGSPTPIRIPFVPERQLPAGDLPLPIPPQTWRFRQSIEYSMTANRAVLDLASRYRETLLLNAYRMGARAIARGSTDSWTTTPRRLQAFGVSGGSTRPRTGLDETPQPAIRFEQALRDPRLRDPRGYILPADQPDFPTATKFVDALLKNGVTVLRASAAFEAAGRRYPAGSYVVKTAQAFRAHVLDMFEPQDHPDDRPSPGAPPTPPYDAAGWTLAFQMGVRFDRVLDGFDGPFVELSGAVAPVPPGPVRGVDGASGFLLSHHQNDAFVAVNRLLAAGHAVYWPADRRSGGAPGGTGAMFVPARPGVLALLRQAAAELGISVTGTRIPPAGEALRVAPVRVGLWDTYGGSVSSGWLRYLLEQYEFPFEVVYPPGLDAGGLRAKYDVLILPDGAVTPRDAAPGPLPADVPAAYRGVVGSVTSTRTLPHLRQFVEEGGTLIAMGGSTVVADLLRLSVSNGLTEAGFGGRSRPVGADRFYVPGSVLRARVDNTLPLGYGFEPDVDVFYDNSPVFRLDGNGPGRQVAWFASATPLRSGWAWGQGLLQGTAMAVDVPLGRGHVVLFGPDVAFRAQPHGTFRFLFNALFFGTATPVPSVPTR
ncbi:MAG: M14 metallopeptidase family protein [Vicinamibacterales bacterium]